VVVQDAQHPLHIDRLHVLDVVHELDLPAHLLGQVFELHLGGLLLHPDAVAVAVQAVAGGEDRLVGALAELVVVAAEVHPGGEEGLGEGVIENVAGGADAELAEERAGTLGDAADLIGCGVQVAGGGLPRRPLGAQLGDAGEQGIEGGVGRRDHDGTGWVKC
jgi:hypothetical protein